MWRFGWRENKWSGTRVKVASAYFLSVLDSMKELMSCSCSQVKYTYNITDSRT